MGRDPPRQGEAVRRDERSAVSNPDYVPRVFDFGRLANLEHNAFYGSRSERDLHHVARRYVEMVRN